VPGPDRLIARPIARRLHDSPPGIGETSASAVAAAIACRFGIEVDPQVTCETRPLMRRIVSERHVGRPDWHALTAGQRRGLAHLLPAPWRRPEFVAYRVDDLPAPETRLARRFGCRYRPDGAHARTARAGNRLGPIR
jgi:hypothetical protein